MNIMRNETKLTLAQIIRNEISFRIFISVLLVIFCVMILSVRDISDHLRLVKNQASQKVESLSNFILSQVLVSNLEAINIALAEFNKENNSVHVIWIKNNKLCLNDGLTLVSPYLSWKYSHNIYDVEKIGYGCLEIYGSLLKNNEVQSLIFSRFFIILIASVIIVLILLPLSWRIPKKLIIEPIYEILSMIENESTKSSIYNDKYPVEINTLMNDILILIKSAEKATTQATLWKLSMQVVHDIRSPLAVINMVLSGLPDIENNSRTLIRNALIRINEIANNLLLNTKGELADASVAQSVETRSENICLILDALISEKSCEYSNRNIKICLQVKDDGGSYYSKIDAVSFKRVISNLINNSVDAIEFGGCVSVTLKSEGGFIKINIKDNGCGIPEDIISKVTNPGFSFNKANGTGIGLSHAKESINNMNGDLVIHSKVNVGTEIIITLPRVAR